MTLSLRTAWRRRHPTPNAAGFTMVETVIAIGLAGIILVGGLASLTRMMISTASARQNQSSSEVLASELERIRALPYASVAMVQSDLYDGSGGTLDPAITQTSGTFWFDNYGKSTSEQIAVATGGQINDHRRIVTRNNTRYTLNVYVTSPVDADGGVYRRVTVNVTWDTPLRQREATTFVTNTRRGLPLPKFQFGNALTVSANTGATFNLPLTLTNRGAPDSWNLTVPTNPRSWIFTWYKDTNGNGVVDSGEPALTDTNGDGTIDTGLLQTDQVFAMVVKATVGSSETAGSVVVTFQATSIAQPTATTAIATVNDTVTVAYPPCGAACTRYFKNAVGAPANSTRQTNMPTAAAAPTAVGPFNFDTNVDSFPGRLIAKGGTGATETTASLMANWQYPTPTAFAVSGTATVNIYATMKNYASTSGTLDVYLRRRSTLTSSCNSSPASAWTTIANATYTVNPWPAAFTLAPITMSVGVPTPVSFTAGNCFEIKVTVDSSSASDVWIAYETTSAPSNISMPITSGVM